MLTRIRGALILARLLAPILVALAVLIATSVAVGQVRDSTEQYASAMSARVDAIQVDLTRATEALQTVGAFVGKTRDAVLAQAEALRALTDRIEIKLPTIPVIDFDLPDINFSVPGVVQLKALGADLAEAARAVGAEIAAIASLGEVPAELQAIAADTTDYAGDLWDTLFGWLRALAIILLIGVLVFILGRLGSFFAELQVGWRMLRYGKEADVAPELLRLEARIRSLERRLAAL